MSSNIVTIYTDGACSGNPGPGGWGALIQYRETSKEIFGYETATTNNRMEIIAAIESLKILNRRCHIELFTDSKYLQSGINDWLPKWQKNNWIKGDKKPVKNLDLWQKLYHQVKQHDIQWYWVKGHSNNLGNQAADRLAVKGKLFAKKMVECQ